jgi:hypothetical protein
VVSVATARLRQSDTSSYPVPRHMPQPPVHAAATDKTVNPRVCRLSS